MSGTARVVWSEGMLLRTQHLQQQDRWIEGLVRGATQGLRHHPWGFRTLEIDTGPLAHGKLALRRASGVLPDGTVFDMPANGPLPDAIEIGQAAAQAIVHLALPVQLADAAEIDPAGLKPTGARWLGQPAKIRDSLAQAQGEADVEVASPRLRLLTEDTAGDAWVRLPVARVAAVQADRGLVLDSEFPVPCLVFGASAWLVSVVEELAGKLERIARERAEYVMGRRVQGAGDLADFLALQLCNRALATARHHAVQRGAHPEDLYLWMLEFLAEASSFLPGDPVAPAVEPYRHEAPWLGFLPLVAELRRVLLELARPTRKAVQIGLRLFPSGARAAEVQDKSLFTDAAFYIAVWAPVPPDMLRDRLPGQITIAPAEELQRLVRAAVPGIPLRHVPTVPREIPVRRQAVYFELEQDNDYWRRLPQAAGLALHVTGELREGMEMECWAVRG